ncbi:MAG: cysteine--tRNA ligase [Candidatus Aenigmatarchaeota archaeon]
MLRLYNTLSKRKQAFRPLKGKIVTMYNCGLTVYDYGHIGNFRSFLFADLLRRWLEYKGYVVKQVMNFTDVGHMTVDEIPAQAGQDKVEMAAKRQGKSPEQIAQFYIDAFLQDSKALNMLEPMKRPRATEHVADMIEIIKRLIARGYAYVTPSGCVYFEVSKFKQYGKLSGNPIEKLMAGARIAPNPEKRHPYDFALWIVDPKHIMQWDSPWGRGYPGWHIECSAMAMKYLGETIDIHTGGEDNIFPHHECEIAQSEGATGKRFARFWLHVRHLLVNGKKMSKSLGNFIVLRDLIKDGHDPRAIRLLLLSAHYRDRLNFTTQALRQAEATIGRLDRLFSELRRADGIGDKKLLSAARRAWNKFCAAMDDDINTPMALSAILSLIPEINKSLQKNYISKKDAKFLMKMFTNFSKIFGIEFLAKEWHGIEDAEPWLRAMLEEREKARKERRWDVADRIRAELKKRGIIVEDSEEGPRWQRQSS